ncbi:MAG: hypothetical protein AAF773_04675 [Cyanobacteria bacterium P01_D01_bin.115]
MGRSLTGWGPFNQAALGQAAPQLLIDCDANSSTITHGWDTKAQGEQQNWQDRLTVAV